MSSLEIHEFLWDDRNEAKVQEHGLSVDSVDEVLLGEAYAVFRNRRGMHGAYQVVGIDFAGTRITVIIQPTSGDPRMWRPVTAWPSKKGEITKARQQGVR